MWIHKDVESIVYIDIERKLEVKPTVYATNECLPFPLKSIHTIFYDPPHGWGEGHPFYKYPDAESFKKEWEGYGEIPRYYGWDKFKSYTQLIRHIYNAQAEFHKILKNDGLLWLKWNEVTIPLRRILTIFTEWHVLLQLRMHQKVHTAGQKDTYWVCLCKKRGKRKQTSLS